VLIGRRISANYWMLIHKQSCGDTLPFPSRIAMKFSGIRNDINILLIDKA
jgi:hypothetical protein